jgi:hypothetical protein
MTTATPVGCLLETAQEWIESKDGAFYRFFDISTEDGKWLLSAAEGDIERLACLPASVFKISLVHADGGSAPRSMLNSYSVSLVTNVLSEIREDLRTSELESRIFWGLSEKDAGWLIESSFSQRNLIAALGRVKFSARDGLVRESASERIDTLQLLLRVLNPSY